MKTLSIIGCGNVGKTLGKLWADAGVFKICEIVNRSIESAARAVSFIGQGNALSNIGELSPADVFLISTSDSAIEQCAAALCGTSCIEPHTILFHCSGFHPANILSAGDNKRRHVASIHPVRSFANPMQVVASFPGTFCGAEGDDNALSVLIPAFEAIGGQIIKIDSRYKPLYHAASVLSSNYVVSLVELASRALEQCGVAKDDAIKMVEPLIRGTLDNIANRGTVAALSGPISRGDCNVVSSQLTAVESWNLKAGGIYRQLGELAVEIAKEKGEADAANLAEISAILSR